MSEPPIHVRPDGVEPSLRHTGSRWVDLTLAGSAILISVISLVIAIAHGRIQEKMVAAASWPVLFLDSGNRDDKSGKEIIGLSVRNDGAGPALLKSVSLSWRGKRYGNVYALLVDCCGWRYIASDADAKTYAVTTSRLSRSVIPPGGERLVLLVPKTPQNQTIWRRLDETRFQFGFDACYCSVLGECWRSDLQGGEPRPVGKCAESDRFSR